MKQVKLQAVENNTELTCWLDGITKRNIGHLVRFKDAKDWWRVRDVYAPELAKQEVRKTWHVGGL